MAMAVAGLAIPGGVVIDVEAVSIEGGDTLNRLGGAMAERPPLSPMFRQYHALKQGHPGAILLFRMGDFYEMFGDDAKTASRLLELTLTARGKGTDNVVPMCVVWAPVPGVSL